MSQTSIEECDESTQERQQQQQQSHSEIKVNAAEIEELYLKIKEDWL